MKTCLKQHVWPRVKNQKSMDPQQLVIWSPFDVAVRFWRIFSSGLFGGREFQQGMSQSLRISRPKGGIKICKKHILCSFQDFDSHLALNSTALHVTIMAASSGTQGDWNPGFLNSEMGLIWQIDGCPPNRHEIESFYVDCDLKWSICLTILISTDTSTKQNHPLSFCCNDEPNVLNQTL